MDNSNTTLQEAARLRRDFKMPWMEMYDHLLDKGFKIYRQEEDESNFAMKHLNHEVLKLYPELRTNKKVKKKRGRKKGSKNKTVKVAKQPIEVPVSAVELTANAKLVIALRANNMKDSDIIDVLIKV